MLKPINRSKGVALILGLGILAFGLLACGGGGSNAAAPSPTPAPAPTPTPTTEASLRVTEASATDPAKVIPSGSTDGHSLLATDFGVVGDQLGDVVNKQEDRSYRIVNIGNAPVQISVHLEGKAANQFSLTQAPGSDPLQPNASMTIQVSWRPFPNATLGDNVATVRVEGAGTDYTFAVVGTMVDGGHH